MNISAFMKADHFLPDWFDVTCFYLFAYFIGMTLFYFTWFLNFLLNYFAVPLMVMSVTVSRQVNTLLNELILTTLTCALSFQHCLVRTQYGNKEYLLVATSAEMVLHYMVQMLRIDGGRSVTAVVVKYLSKEISFCIAIICAILQVVAVLTVGKFVQLLWHLQGFAELFEHYHPTRCVTDLKVSTACGFITEGAATMFLVWVNLQHSSVSLYARSFIPALMVIAGSSYTGMYMHPTLASAMTFGCKGETICDHIMVYWAAPIIGCTMAYYLHRCITG